MTFLLKIFDTALEDVEEFGGFGDFMCSFNLLRGKKTEDEDDEERRFSGRFKVGLVFLSENLSIFGMMLLMLF